MAYSKNAVDKHSKEHREHNDCAVRSLALTTALSYTQAHAILARCGRRPRRGTLFPVTKSAFEKSGYELVPVQVTAKTIVTLENDPAIRASYNYGRISFNKFIMVPGQDHIDFRTVLVEGFLQLFGDGQRNVLFLELTFRLGNMKMLVSLAY